MLQKWILATSEFGQELQQDINKITGGDEKFNNAVVRRVLDLKNAGLFQNPEPINLAFSDVKKFDQQNPIIGKELTKKRFMKAEIAKIEDRLFELKRRDNLDKYNNSDDEDGATPPPPAGGSSAPPMREAEMDPSFRRLTKEDEALPEKKDLKKLFDEVYGQQETKSTDPFSPEFREDVHEDPIDTVREKTERDIVEPR